LWVKQRKGEPERVRTYYRHKPLGLYSDAIREENLFVVHGLLAYGSTEHGHELAGSYTRIGPDPVVNFSRGGQVVPGILQ
jgi:hypothetical protein